MWRPPPAVAQAQAQAQAAVRGLHATRHQPAAAGTGGCPVVASAAPGAPVRAHRRHSCGVTPPRLPAPALGCAFASLLLPAPQPIRRRGVQARCLSSHARDAPADIHDMEMTALEEDHSAWHAALREEEAAAAGAEAAADGDVSLLPRERRLRDLESAEHARQSLPLLALTTQLRALPAELRWGPHAPSEQLLLRCEQILAAVLALLHVDPAYVAHRLTLADYTAIFECCHTLTGDGVQAGGSHSSTVGRAVHSSLLQHARSFAKLMLLQTMAGREEALLRHPDYASHTAALPETATVARPSAPAAAATVSASVPSTTAPPPAVPLDHWGTLLRVPHTQVQQLLSLSDDAELLAGMYQLLSCTWNTPISEPGPPSERDAAVESPTRAVQMTPPQRQNSSRHTKLPAELPTTASEFATLLCNVATQRAYDSLSCMDYLRFRMRHCQPRLLFSGEDVRRMLQFLGRHEAFAVRLRRWAMEDACWWMEPTREDSDTRAPAGQAEEAAVQARTRRQVEGIIAQLESLHDAQTRAAQQSFATSSSAAPTAAAPSSDVSSSFSSLARELLLNFFSLVPVTGVFLERTFVSFSQYKNLLFLCGALHVPDLALAFWPRLVQQQEIMVQIKHGKYSNKHRAAAQLQGVQPRIPQHAISLLLQAVSHSPSHGVESAERLMRSMRAPDMRARVELDVFPQVKIMDMAEDPLPEDPVARAARVAEVRRLYGLVPSPSAWVHGAVCHVMTRAEEYADADAAFDRMRVAPCDTEAVDQTILLEQLQALRRRLEATPSSACTHRQLLLRRAELLWVEVKRRVTPSSQTLRELLLCFAAVGDIARQRDLLAEGAAMESLLQAHSRVGADLPVIASPECFGVVLESMQAHAHPESIERYTDELRQLMQKRHAQALAAGRIVRARRLDPERVLKSQPSVAQQHSASSMQVLRASRAWQLTQLLEEEAESPMPADAAPASALAAATTMAAHAAPAAVAPLLSDLRGAGVVHSSVAPPDVRVHADLLLTSMLHDGHSLSASDVESAASSFPAAAWNARNVRTFLRVYTVVRGEDAELALRIFEGCTEPQSAKVFALLFRCLAGRVWHASHETTLLSLRDRMVTHRPVPLRFDARDVDMMHRGMCASPVAAAMLHRWAMEDGAWAGLSRATQRRIIAKAEKVDHDVAADVSESVTLSTDHPSHPFIQRLALLREGGVPLVEQVTGAVVYPENPSSYVPSKRAEQLAAIACGDADVPAAVSSHAPTPAQPSLSDAAPPEVAISTAATTTDNPSLIVAEPQLHAPAATQHAGTQRAEPATPPAEVVPAVPSEPTVTPAATQTSVDPTVMQQQPPAEIKEIKETAWVQVLEAVAVPPALGAGGDASPAASAPAPSPVVTSAEHVHTSLRDLQREREGGMSFMSRCAFYVDQLLMDGFRRPANQSRWGGILSALENPEYEEEGTGQEEQAALQARIHAFMDAHPSTRSAAAIDATVSAFPLHVWSLPSLHSCLSLYSSVPAGAAPALRLFSWLTGEGGLAPSAETYARVFATLGTGWSPRHPARMQALRADMRARYPPLSFTRAHMQRMYSSLRMHADAVSLLHRWAKEDGLTLWMQPHVRKHMQEAAEQHSGKQGPSLSSQQPAQLAHEAIAPV